jgi:dihydroorotate dehydrogenase
VQVGTANFVHPDTGTRIVDYLQDYCLRHRVADISELRGIV